MPQAHPRAFLPEAEALAHVRIDPDEAAIWAVIDRGRCAQHDHLARTAEHDVGHTRRASPSRPAEFLALVIALLEAQEARTTAHCSHLHAPFDPTVHLVVDLTSGWVSCGCDEQISLARADDGRCDLCDQPPATGLLFEARMTAGPMHTYRADVCRPCWDWIEPLYRRPADRGTDDRSRRSRCARRRR